MINRAPIATSAATGTHMEKTKDGPFYKEFSADMTFLYGVLYDVFGVTTVGVYTKQSYKSKNGRYALFILNNFLLGPQYVTHMAVQLKLKLRRFSYSGDRIGFFQKFVNLHKGQHIIADGFMEYAYSGVHDNSKLYMLMHGINTNALNTCKSSILAIPDMQGGFDIAARKFLDFIAITPSIQNNATAKVSSVTRRGGWKRRWAWKWPWIRHALQLWCLGWYGCHQEQKLPWILTGLCPHGWVQENVQCS